MKIPHKNTPNEIINAKVKKSKKEYFNEYILTSSHNNINDIPAYLALHRGELKSLIEEMVKDNKSIKGQLSLECKYERKLVTGESQEISMYYGLGAIEIYNIDDFLTTQFQKLKLREILNQPNAGSEWTLSRCEQLILRLNKHNCLNVGSYIKLPDEIKNKEACIHSENKDEYCFIYSIRLSYVIKRYKDI